MALVLIYMCFYDSSWLFKHIFTNFEIFRFVYTSIPPHFIRHQFHMAEVRLLRQKLNRAEAKIPSLKARLQEKSKIIKDLRKTISHLESKLVKVDQAVVERKRLKQSKKRLESKLDKADTAVVEMKIIHFLGIKSDPKCPKLTSSDLK